MLTELIKCCELVYLAVKDRRSAEAHRAKVARHLVSIYVTIKDIVERGRELTAIGELTLSDTQKRYIPFRSLLAQQASLEKLQQLLNSDLIGDVLQLHLPAFTAQLTMLARGKGERIIFRIEQIIDPRRMPTLDEQVLSSYSDWVSDDHKEFYAKHGVLPLIYTRDIKMDVGNFGWLKSDDSFVEIPKVRNDSVTVGYKLLDALSEKNEQLRTFLLEKFKLEDIL